MLRINLEFDDRKIHINTIYKPNVNLMSFIEKCVEILSTVRVGKNEELFVCEDFNIDLLEFENDYDTQTFLMSLQSLSLLPVIRKPTRIADTSATLIIIFMLLISIRCYLVSLLIISPTTCLLS